MLPLYDLQRSIALFFAFLCIEKGSVNFSARIPMDIDVISGAFRQRQWYGLLGQGVI